MTPSLYLVAGLGKTGHSIARYLQRHNKPFVAFDTRDEPANLQQFKTEFPGIEVYLGEIPQTVLGQLTEIISSPGVALDDFSLKKARELSIPIVGDIEYLARAINAPVIAITGTNGKSTVTTLVGEMASDAGLNVAVAGNIGLPVLDLLADDTHYDLWVLELSSFQLDLTHSLAPVAATILNITPDHLDRHHSMEAYQQAKQRIYHQAKTILYNRGDKSTFAMEKATPTQSKRVSFGLDTPSIGNWGIVDKDGLKQLSYSGEALLPVDALRIKGRHNWENALAACALAATAGISHHSMIEVLQHFKGLPHRSQWVRELNGVDWINDSKGTNIGATISAISGIGGSMQGKIVLIAGGQGKGADFRDMREPMAEYVRSVVLIGEDADKIEKALEDIVMIERASTLQDAVQLAKSQAKPGDVVLLSPACASLDMFKDFNQRGDVFTQAVEAL